MVTSSITGKGWTSWRRGGQIQGLCDFPETGEEVSGRVKVKAEGAGQGCCATSPQALRGSPVIQVMSVVGLFILSTGLHWTQSQNPIIPPWLCEGCRMNRDKAKMSQLTKCLFFSSNKSNTENIKNERRATQNPTNLDQSLFMFSVYLPLVIFDCVH